MITDTAENGHLLDEGGNIVGVESPLSVDGDSVYPKDIDVENSNIGDFTGEVIDLFKDYRSPQVAVAVGSGGANPKSFTIALKRPVASTIVGIPSSNSSISNSKLTLKGISGDIIKVIDLSTDDTKKGVQIFQFEQQFFSEVLIEFYTDDEVIIEGVGIFKSNNVSIDAINGVISYTNSSKTPLLASGVFSGDPIDTKNYGIIICSVYSDVASATNGLLIEFSTDQTNWFWSDEYTIAALTGKTFSVQTQARWMRVNYTNGITDQTVFQIETTLKPVYIKPSSHRILDPISGQDDAELVKAILTGQDLVSGIFENVKSFDGALSVTDGYVYKRALNKFVQRDSGGSTNPTNPITSGDRVVTFDSVVDFLIGDYVDLHEGIKVEMLPLIIRNIVGNDVTFNRPINFNYSTAANLDEIEVNMNKDGSITPISYKIAPPAGQIWQFTRLIVSILATTTMDDGKFGGIPALPNGLLLSTYRDGITASPSLWQTNGDMANDMFNVDYVPKAPAGQNGLRGRWTITNMGAIIELNGDNGDYTEILNQDDLTGNTSFTLKGQGRIFGN